VHAFRAVVCMGRGRGGLRAAGLRGNNRRHMRSNDRRRQNPHDSALHEYATLTGEGYRL